MATNNTRSIWKRLKRNKGAVFGIVVITLAVLTAIFAHLVAPDPSPNANRMIVELDGQKPGFRQQFLMLPKQRAIDDVSFFRQLVSGKEDVFQYVPITGYSITKDSIIVQQYLDEGVSDRKAFALGEVPGHQVVTKKFLLGTDKYGREIGRAH